MAIENRNPFDEWLNFGYLLNVKYLIAWNSQNTNLNLMVTQLLNA